MKDQIRALCRRRRKETENRQEKEETILCRLKEKLAGCRTVLLYAPIDGEVDITPLFEGPWEVCLPRVVGNEIVPVKIGKGFYEGAFGIREPKGNPFEGSIDAAAVPLVAFDVRRGRIGFGKGCYDRFLALHPGIYTLGVAFECQKVQDTFQTEFDRRLSCIVTEHAVYGG